MLRDRTILITGGTGSFGQHFTDRLLRRHQPRHIIIYSRDEWKQDEMNKRFNDERLRFVIGDVRDAKWLRRACRGVDCLVHAAALKQVPAAEANPLEAIQTNILGAQNVIEAAVDNNVRRVVALSTDKACNPVNLYGATKLCAEKLFLSGLYNGTQFAVVRYGNVSGTRGSVVPFFMNCAARGEPLPITDVRMTRFWLTLDDSVNLVLNALKVMHGGELFVPHVPSVHVVDLAQAVAPGRPTTLVGIRPGEKLHETLISNDDAHRTIECDKFYIIGQDLRHHGTPVSPDFAYRSDTNPWWLDVNELHDVIYNPSEDEET